MLQRVHVGGLVPYPFIKNGTCAIRSELLIVSISGHVFLLLLIFLDLFLLGNMYVHSSLLFNFELYCVVAYWK